MRLLGILEIFQFAPWIILFMFKLFDQPKPVNWIILITFLGIGSHHYGIIYTISFLLLLILSLLLKNRQDFKTFFSLLRLKNLGLLLILILIYVGLTSPLWTTAIFDINKIIPVARTLDGTTKGLFLSLGEISKAEVFWKGASYPWDFLGLINPFFPRAVIWKWYSTYTKGKILSESFLYIGFLPLLIAVIGIFKSKQKYKINFLLLLILTAGLMLGTKSTIFNLFATVFSPIRFGRHATHFFPFFLLCLYYFFCLGLDLILERYDKIKTTITQNTPIFSLISKELFFKVSIIAVLFLSLVYFRKKIALDVRYLLYFYISQLFAISLMSEAFRKAKALRLLILLIVVFDLSLFNCFNRMLTYTKYDLNFNTSAQIFNFPNKREIFIANKSQIPRFKSILFRQPAIEDTSATEESSFFELKNFHQILSLPEENLNLISSINKPIIHFYSQGLIYHPQYFKTYFNNPQTKDFLAKVLFLHDIKTMDNSLTYHPNCLLEKIPVDDFSYKLIKYTPSDIKLTTQTTHSGFLFLSDGYDNYWSAYIDSKKTNLYRADINFKAIIIPKGEHDIEFIYRPIFHLISLDLFFIILFLISIYLCYNFKVNLSKKPKKLSY